jgi:hypothetical protein
MKNISFIFHTSIILLSFSILLTGCRSFYEVSKDDYGNLEKINDIKVVYKNGKEFVVEKDETINIKIIGDSLIVFQGIETKSIGMNEVEKIRESRFDFGGTFSLIVGTLVLIILLVPAYSPGG